MSTVLPSERAPQQVSTHTIVTRISYHFRDVTTRYQTATYQAREAWNDSLSVPHFNGTGSTSADFNVYDAEYQSNDWWFWVVHDCSSTHVSKKYMHWNARTMAMSDEWVHPEFGWVYYPVAFYGEEGKGQLRDRATERLAAASPQGKTVDEVLREANQGVTFHASTMTD